MCLSDGPGKHKGRESADKHRRTYCRRGGPARTLVAKSGEGLIQDRNEGNKNSIGKGH